MLGILVEAGPLLFTSLGELIKRTYKDWHWSHNSFPGMMRSRGFAPDASVSVFLNDYLCSRMLPQVIHMLEMEPNFGVLSNLLLQISLRSIIQPIVIYWPIWNCK